MIKAVYGKVEAPTPNKKLVNIFKLGKNTKLIDKFDKRFFVFYSQKCNKTHENEIPMGKIFNSSEFFVL